MLLAWRILIFKKILYILVLAIGYYLFFFLFLFPPARRKKYFNFVTLTQIFGSPGDVEDKLVLLSHFSVELN